MQRMNADFLILSAKIRRIRENSRPIFKLHTKFGFRLVIQLRAG